MDSIINQDGGPVRAIYANSMAMASVAMNDNTISDEAKSVIEQLQKQTQELFNILQKSENFSKPLRLTGTT